MASSSTTTPFQPTHHEQAFTLQKYLLLHGQHDALQQHIHASDPQHDFHRTTSRHRGGSLSSQSSGATTSQARDGRRRSISPLTPLSPLSSSTIMSPISNSSSPLTPTAAHPPRQHRRHASLPLTAFPPPAPLRTHASDPSSTLLTTEESQLHDVNLRMKTTLMELLGCEDVRADDAYRAWVQARLMEAEMELKEMRHGRRMSGRRGSIQE